MKWNTFLNLFIYDRTLIWSVLNIAVVNQLFFNEGSEAFHKKHLAIRAINHRAVKTYILTAHTYSQLVHSSWSSSRQVYLFDIIPLCWGPQAVNKERWHGICRYHVIVVWTAYLNGSLFSNYLSHTESCSVYNICSDILNCRFLNCANITLWKTYK